MGLNGRGGGGGGGGSEDTASNGSLMRDGQSGLYLITNQQSFEFSGGGRCVCCMWSVWINPACVAEH